MADITESYLQGDMIKKVKHALDKQPIPCIALQQFLKPDAYKKMLGNLRTLKAEPDVDLLEHHYNVATMSEQFSELLGSKDMLQFLQKVSGTKEDISWELRTFSAKDYTILSDHPEEKPGYDIYLDLTTEWPEGAGGDLIYVDGTGDSLKVPPQGNTLIIARRTEKVRGFVQYCNHRASGYARILAYCSL